MPPQRASVPELVVLHEDNHVLAVDKPAGLLSQADLTGDLDVLTLARRMIKLRDAKPGNVYLGLVHRLDRPVAGVMILAKTSKAAARLSRQLRDRAMRKTYRAVVEGSPEPGEAELRHRLVRDRDARRTRVASPDETAREAVLGYRVLASRGDASLVEVDLVTGLPHQIRAQLAAAGHPVFGDRKYGGARRVADGRVALHARSIEFEHPVRRERVIVESRTPAWWPW